MIVIVEISTRMIKEFANGYSLLTYIGFSGVSDYYTHMSVHPCVNTDAHTDVHIYVWKSRDGLYGNRHTSCEGILVCLVIAQSNIKALESGSLRFESGFSLTSYAVLGNGLYLAAGSQAVPGDAVSSSASPGNVLETQSLWLNCSLPKSQTLAVAPKINFSKPSS